jgi:hypothetical protein
MCFSFPRSGALASSLSSALPSLLGVEPEHVTIGRIGHVFRRAERRKDKRLESVQALAFLKKEGTPFLDIIPPNDEYPALAEAVTTGSEGLLNVNFCVQAPAEDAVAQDQIERAGPEVFAEVLQSIDNVPLRPVLFFRRIDLVYQSQPTNKMSL